MSSRETIAHHPTVIVTPGRGTASLRMTTTNQDCETEHVFHAAGLATEVKQN